MNLMKKYCLIPIGVLILQLFFIPIRAEDPLKRAEKLKIKLNSTPIKTEKIPILVQLAGELAKLRSDESIRYGQQAVQLADESGNKSFRGNGLLQLALGYWFKGNKEKAFACVNEALVLFKQLKNKEGTIDATSRLALLYKLDFKYEQSLKHYLDALTMAIDIGDDARIAFLFFESGKIYHRLDDISKAMEYYQKALDLVKKTNNENIRAEILNNIGLAYEQKKDFAKALEFYQQAQLFFKKVNDEYWISIIDRNIGKVYQDLNQPDQTLTYYYKTLKYIQKIGDEAWEAGVLIDISQQHLKKKDIQESIKFIKIAIDKAEKKVRKDILLECYILYANILVEKKDFPEAIKYLHLYIKTKENMINEGKNREVARLQEGFAARDRTRTIELLEKTAQIEKIRRQILYGGIVVLLMILAFVIYKFRHFFIFWKKEKYLGGYRLLEPIGTGGMGNVFKAHPVRNRSRVVAVKILKDELFQLESTKKRFRREGDIIDRFDHPNILKIYERGEIDNKLYLVMEYIDGITLEKRIERDGKLEVNACRHIMIQITSALACIHANDIIHRDLKPANIMLTRLGNDENVVKLLDFGLSRLKDQSQMTQTGILIGTMNYLAPEQILLSSHTFASDVYSLGIIFYEMLSGQKAFAGETFTDIIHQVLEITPPDLSQLRPESPPALNLLVKAMISKESSKRPNIETVSNSLDRLN